MKTAEKKLIERNLDLLFEFEKYVLEHRRLPKRSLGTLLCYESGRRRKVQSLE
jgi:hypothetical protein